MQRQPEADPDRVRQALQLWNGNIGKAMESLEDGEAAKYSALSAELCRALVAENEYALICACAPLQKDRQAVLNIWRGAAGSVSGRIGAGQRRRFAFRQR